MKFSLEEIALHVDGTVLGDSSIQISEVAEIQNARVGSITFLSNQMYNKYLNTTEASAIFVSDEKLVQHRNGILVDNPQLAIAKTLALFSLMKFILKIFTLALILIPQLRLART